LLIFVTNLAIICDKNDVILFYTEKTISLGWSRDILLNYQKADTYKSQKRMPVLVANDKEWLQGGNLILNNDKLLASAEFEGPMMMSFFD
jgi:hypothetical protein